ncbi:MAG: phage holin family protein [Bacteroidia bacterium]
MNNFDKTSFFSDFKELLVDYIQNRLELSKALAFEKIAKIVAYLVIGLVLALLFFFGLMFLSFMLAYYLADTLSSQLSGFAIVGGLYFVAFYIIFSFREKLLAHIIVDSIIKILYERQNDGNETEN